jgi:DNA-binding transcriptional ArsR family regulator
MKDGPSIAPVAALAGDPARANMLAALSGGMALTASELAGEAGVTLQTASSHLAKLERAGLISATPQGRHRYFRLADNDVAQMLESIMNVAARTGQMRTRPGPCDPALRRARICYDHLAGEMGVGLLDGLVGKECVVRERDELRLTQAGIAFMTNLRIDIDQLSNQRRPLCRPCLDWSMRRHHLGGALGAALLKKFQELRWIARIGESRALRFTPSGEIQFLKIFGAVVPQSQA